MTLGLFFFSSPCDAAKGKELTITFQVNKKETVTPSCCLAIWLEAMDGTYVKTIFASDWMAPYAGPHQLCWARPGYTDEWVVA